MLILTHSLRLNLKKQWCRCYRQMCSHKQAISNIVSLQISKGGSCLTLETNWRRRSLFVVPKIISIFVLISFLNRGTFENTFQMKREIYRYCCYRLYIIMLLQSAISSTWLNVGALCLWNSTSLCSFSQLIPHLTLLSQTFILYLTFSWYSPNLRQFLSKSLSFTYFSHIENRCS